VHGGVPLGSVIDAVMPETVSVVDEVRVQPSLSVTVSVYFVVAVGDTVKSRHFVPEASPFVVCVWVLPSSPSSLSVNGPRLSGAWTHALNVALPPQATAQPDVGHDSVQP
jgi:hypothetical protein